jgi:hypothetical protein
MQVEDSAILCELIPDSDEVRRRLSIALAEADLLRSQLRVSDRAAKEQERLCRQKHEGG